MSALDNLKSYISKNIKEQSVEPSPQITEEVIPEEIGDDVVENEQEYMSTLADEVTKILPPKVEEKEVQKVEEKHQEVEQIDNDLDGLIKKARKILQQKAKMSGKRTKHYPKRDENGLCLYYNFENYGKKNYDTERYAAYNSVIDQINNFFGNRQISVKEEHLARQNAFKEVTKAFDTGASKISTEQAKEVAKVKAMDISSTPFDAFTDEAIYFPSTEFSVSKTKPVEEKKKEIQEVKGKGTVESDILLSKQRLLEDEKKLKDALAKYKESGNEDAFNRIKDGLIRTQSKLESLDESYDREQKEKKHIAELGELDKAKEEQESKGIDSIVINGKELKCKCAIIRENEWKDLTNELDKNLIDVDERHDAGYCNMYNSIMIRRLVTHYVIEHFGSTKRINKIYVKDLNLYINDTLLLYKGALFSKVSEHRIPQDVMPYFKSGKLAPFFDWGIFYQGIHCGGRPLNLKEIYVDDAKYLAEYVAPDISDLRECKHKEMLQSPYCFMSPETYFTLFKNLLCVTIEDNTFTRLDWEKNKEEEQKKVDETVKREKRRIHLLDGYKLDVYSGTNGFQKFGTSCFTNYIKNRGNKGFVRFALGSSARFIFAGAGILTNFTAHLIGGIYHSLKSDNEYEWNDSIKDKMDVDSPITSSDTEEEIEDSVEDATQQAEETQQ